jgi:hypothetical protein
MSITRFAHGYVARYKNITAFDRDRKAVIRKMATILKEIHA